MKLLLIFNSQAQSGRADKKLNAIRQAFSDSSVDHELAVTNEPGHATELARDASAEVFDGVVAIGGDGTCFEVLNGLFEAKHHCKLPLGIIPLGTGNAFAREFGLFPANWREAVSLIASGNSRLVDVGHVTCSQDKFYFLNIIGMGFVTSAGLSARQFKRFGSGAYTLGTLKEVFRLKSYLLSMTSDDRSVCQENTFVEISNSRYTGTDFLIAPAAKVDDGLLDITLLNKVGKWRLLRLFPTIFRGEHINFKEIECLQASKINIDHPPGMQMTVDGEFRGETPAEIVCLPKALRLLI